MLRLGIVGCGDVAARYARTLEGRDALEIVAATDVDRARAREFAEQYGGAVRASLDELLGDEAVDCVLNLTSFDAHADVTARALEAGKHVHSEKPLALDPETAQGLVDLAARTGRRLSCSPITFLGDAQQAAWRAIQSGRAGTIRLVYAEVNHGRIEVWHPRPEAFYAIGPLFDVAVYPLTILAAFFGRVPGRVGAWSRILLPDRVTFEGRPFQVEAPDLVVAVVELENGLVARLTATFYVGRQSAQRGMEFHGDDGSIRLGDWQQFDAPVSFADLQGNAEQLALANGFNGIDFGLALAELAAAIEEDRPHAASGALAAHVVEVLCAIERSARSGEAVAVRSGFEPPLAPLSA